MILFLLYKKETNKCSIGIFTFPRSFCFQTHLTFGSEFTQAVEMKQVAQQDAERARFVVEKVHIAASSTCFYFKRLFTKCIIILFVHFFNINHVFYCTVLENVIQYSFEICQF